MSVTIDSLDIQIRSSAGSAKQKIEELAKALESMSGHKTVRLITAALSKLPEPAKKSATAITKLGKANRDAASAADKHTKALSNQSIGLLATYEHLSNVFSMLHGIQDAASKVLNDAIQWDGIQFRFGRAFGEDAEEVLAYAEKVSKTLRINQQQFMQYSSMYGSLLSGFGMAQEQVTTISVGLTELSYDIWAAYNDRYKSLEDASEAIRSAITGEIEPIRNAGIALTEASMQEYLDSIGMASTSVEKLTEAQKSELRYAVMVNSAMQQGIIGTYAREMQTAEGAVRTLTQQFKTFGQALGSLFIPLLQKALPWLSALVELATEGLIALGAMFGIEFQEIQWGDATGMKQTADSANATADALGTAAKNTKKMMDYTMGFDELNVINPPSDSSGSGGAGGAGDAGGRSLGLDLDTLWDNAVFESASKQIDELKQKIKDYVEEHKVMLTVVGSVTAFFTLANAIRKVNEILGITKTLGTVVTVFKGIVSFGKDAGAFFSLLKEGAGFLPTLAATFPNLANGLATFGGAIKGALTAMGGLIGGGVGAGLAVLAAAIAAVVAVVVFLKNNWEEVTNAVKGFFETNIVPKLESIKESFEKMKAALPEGVVLWLENVIQKVKEFFESGKLLDGIGKAFEVVGGVIFSVAGGAIAGAFSTIMQLIQGVIKAFSGVVQYISGLVEFWKAVFSGGDLTEPLKKMGAGILDILQGLYDVTIGVVVSFVESIVGWFVSLASEIFPGFDDFCDGIKEKVKNLWGDIKSWWNTNVAPKFTVAYWKNKFNVIKTAIGNKLDEVKDIISAKWVQIKGWFIQNVAPKFTLAFWVDKFKNLKTGFTQTIKNAVNAGIDLMNKFIGWINQKLNFSWDAVRIAGQEIVPSGSIQLFTIPSIPRLETGGFLEDGLFTMNHGEIAGKFSNGKSVVANNQQIVDGIAAGVYQAVVSAMNATNGRNEQSVNVYLDGKQIYSSMKKAESERGLSIMGNQLGYAF